MSKPVATDRPGRPAAPRRQLTLFDSTCIIVGIIIGAGIYETSPLIASNLPGPWWLIGAWLLGGLLSLIGALCYAELATAYPKEGGDYVYLTRAFGRSPGFLFAWAQLWVVRPGSIGAMAYVFARYANQLWPRWEGPHELFVLMAYAVASILILTGINIIGVREGKWTQNLLTTAKVLGLAAIVIVGLWFVTPNAPGQGRGTGDEGSGMRDEGRVGTEDLAAGSSPLADEPGFNLAEFGFAMILILFTYGGWNEMAYVGAEVRNPTRNILRALVLGTISVTVIYVLVTLAFVNALGFDGTRTSNAVAADLLEQTSGKWGDWGARVISLLVCVSTLGAINGQIFTGARIYYAMGTDHRLYARLGRWSRRLGTPVWSLVVQAAITLLLVIAFGLLTDGAFQSMIEFTTPIAWVFFLLVGLSLFVLRHREPDTPRPYRVPWYPLMPILFCLSSLFILYSSLAYALKQGSYEPIWAVAMMLIGVALSFYNPKLDS
jgi:amino acid transporter